MCASVCVRAVCVCACACVCARACTRVKENMPSRTCCVVKQCIQYHSHAMFLFIFTARVFGLGTIRSLFRTSPLLPAVGDPWLPALPRGDWNPQLLGPRVSGAVRVGRAHGRSRGLGPDLVRQDGRLPLSPSSRSCRYDFFINRIVKHVTNVCVALI